MKIDIRVVFSILTPKFHNRNYIYTCISLLIFLYMLVYLHQCYLKPIKTNTN